MRTRRTNDNSWNGKGRVMVWILNKSKQNARSKGLEEACWCSISIVLDLVNDA